LSAFFIVAALITEVLFKQFFTSKGWERGKKTEYSWGKAGGGERDRVSLVQTTGVGGRGLFAWVTLVTDKFYQ